MLDGTLPGKWKPDLRQHSSPRGSHTVVAHRSGQPAHLEGAEERKIGRFTDDKAGTSRQDRSTAVRGRWPVEQPRKKGTPRGRSRRVFTAASCKHTKDKHDPIRGKTTRGLPNQEYPEVVLRHVSVRRCEGSHHARQHAMKGLNGAFAWRQ